MMERIDPEVASMKSVNDDGSDTSIFLKKDTSNSSIFLGMAKEKASSHARFFRKLYQTHLEIYIVYFMSTLG